MLVVSDLNGWYGESHVLHGVTFDLNEGEVVTLLGRNGAGKSSTLRAIMGLLKKRSGSIRFNGEETIRRSPIRIARQGIGYVPEERGIFATLTVRENLMLPPRLRETAFDLQRIFELFPNLHERLGSMGTTLSGGEQQMLAIARILRTGCKLLLLDEPTEGLAPVIVQQIENVLLGLKSEGLTVVLVEQNLYFASVVSDRCFVIEQGRVVDSLLKSEFGAKAAKLQTYIGV